MTDAREETLQDRLLREARWYRRHPRAHFDDHGMCAISPTEADDTAQLLEDAARALSPVHERNHD
jgi:hypothetical protein